MLENFRCVQDARSEWKSFHFAGGAAIVDVTMCYSSVPLNITTASARVLFSFSCTVENTRKFHPRDERDIIAT